MSDEHRWRSAQLGEAGSVEVPGGAIEYFERGAGPALVFSHGWLANANLWRKVVDLLCGEFRCLALDLPLGSHRTPMDADVDLSPGGVGALVADVVERLDLREATLVGNDSGGAYSQIALAEHSERIGDRVSSLVLTSCETPYDEWPPPPFDGLPAAARDS
jgi:pimeloyl-ACP methyl ester carboxylesterase